MNNIHKTAIVSKNAIVGENVTIGAYSVIGDNVKIANNNITKIFCALLNNVSRLSKGLIYHEKSKVKVSNISNVKRGIFYSY